MWKSLSVVGWLIMLAGIVIIVYKAGWLFALGLILFAWGHDMEKAGSRKEQEKFEDFISNLQRR